MSRKSKSALGKRAASALTQEQLNDLIQKKAYELFEHHGRKPGNDFDHWLKAEKLVKEELKIQ